MKTLQTRIDERADKNLSDSIAKTAEPFRTMMQYCNEMPYEKRGPHMLAITAMKSDLFDAMKQKNREQETANFMKSVENLRDQIDSMQ